MSQPSLDESISTAVYDKLKKKVKQALEENIAPGETIRVLIRGAHGQAIVGTDNRAFVCKPGFMAGASFGAEITSWSYQNLVGVQAHKGLMSGSVVLQGPGQSGKKRATGEEGRTTQPKHPTRSRWQGTGATLTGELRGFVS